MTFEQFQTTRQWCDNLGKALKDSRWDDEPPAKGYLYLGRLYIEQAPQWLPVGSKGGWSLLLHNREYLSNKLQRLERRLYDWAKAEDYFDSAPQTTQTKG